jgi:hypothetical protein
MKNTIITITFILLSFISNSQVITVKFDTIQFFSHSASINTEKARLTNKVVYGDLAKCLKTEVITFDLDSMVERYNGFENLIIKKNNSENLVDIEVDESGRVGLCILGKTEDDQMIYLFETINGDEIEGYFVINPTIIQ